MVDTAAVRSESVMNSTKLGTLVRLGAAAHPHLLEGLFRAFLHAESVHGNEPHPSPGPGRRPDVLACWDNMVAPSSSLQNAEGLHGPALASWELCRLLSFHACSEFCPGEDLIP